MAVPAPGAGHVVTAHGLVAPDHILECRHEDGAVVRAARRKGRTVVEYELGLVTGLLKGALEGSVPLPLLHDSLLQGGEMRTGLNFAEAMLLCHTKSEEQGATNASQKPATGVAPERKSTRSPT